jgi:CHASE2 domain-containing sensor protein
MPDNPVMTLAAFAFVFSFLSMFALGFAYMAGRQSGQAHMIIAVGSIVAAGLVAFLLGQQIPYTPWLHSLIGLYR